MGLIEVIANDDRLGRKVRVKCSPDDTVGDLKKLLAVRTGSEARTIVLKKGDAVYNDHITLADYEIGDGASLEMDSQADASFVDLIEVVANDRRLGRKVRVKCSADNTVGDLKKLLAVRIGIEAGKMILKNRDTVYNDYRTLAASEIHDGMSLEVDSKADDSSHYVHSTPSGANARNPLIEVIANDRLGRKVHVKCSPDDTVGDLKKLLAAQLGTDSRKIILKKWYTVYKDHITLADYEIHDGMSLEMY